MTDEPLKRLLGTPARDPGCEGAFEVLDQYVEACREDTEGLLAALDDLEPPPPAR